MGRLENGERKVFGWTFVIALIVYLLTLAPDLTWAHHGSDGGELITASVTLGVPHPSGYPTYILLGKLFSLLPIGSVAYRFNLFSAVTMSVAAGLLSVTAYHIPPRPAADERFALFWDFFSNVRPSRIGAICVGLTFAFAPLVWEQAIITEVYALNLAVIATLLWVLTTRKSAWLVGILFGLSLTTHLTSLLLAPIVLWSIPRQQWRKVVIGSALGLTPFLLLPIFARDDSPVVWGNPTTLANWWWVVGGVIYRPNLLNHPIFPRLTDSILPALRQFSFIGWILLAISVQRSAFSKRTIVAESDPSIHHSPFTIHHLPFTISIFLYSLYALTYDTVDAEVFALPALLLCALLLASTYHRLGRWAIVLPLLAIALNFNTVNLHNDTAVRTTVEQLWTQIPEDAVVMTLGDQSIFSLWYYHHVENQRPDVILVDANLFAFDWYRNRLHSDLVAVEVDDLEAFEQENSKNFPFCTVSLQYINELKCQ